MSLIGLNQKLLAWEREEELSEFAANLSLKQKEWWVLMAYRLQVQRYQSLEAKTYHQVQGQKQENYCWTLMKMDLSSTQVEQDQESEQQAESQLMKFEKIQNCHSLMMIANLQLILEQGQMEEELGQMKKLMLMMKREALLALDYSEALLTQIQNLFAFEPALVEEQLLQLELNFGRSEYCQNWLVSYQSFQHWIALYQHQVFWQLQNQQQSILPYLLLLVSNQLIAYSDLGKLLGEVFGINLKQRKQDSSFLHRLLEWMWTRRKMWDCSMSIDCVPSPHR